MFVHKIVQHVVTMKYRFTERLRKFLSGPMLVMFESSSRVQSISSVLYFDKF